MSLLIHEQAVAEDISDGHKPMFCLKALWQLSQVWVDNVQNGLFSLLVLLALNADNHINVYNLILVILN